MKTYTVHFEIFGKEMKTKVKAFNEAGAEAIVRNAVWKQIKFSEIKEDGMFSGDPLSDIMDTFGFK